MKPRRGPWLSGLSVALLGAVWMIGQVLGGAVTLVGGLLSVDNSLSAPVAIPESSDTFVLGAGDGRTKRARPTGRCDGR